MVGQTRLPAASIDEDLAVYADGAEPLTALLRDRFGFSPLAVGALAVLAYLGVLMVLHALAGTPRPANVGQALSPSDKVRGFYYPNLNAILFDLIGNPLVLVFLTAFGEYIPTQFRQLQRNGVIKPARSSRFLTGLVRLQVLNRRIPFRVVYLLLLAVALIVAYFSPEIDLVSGALQVWTFILVTVSTYAKLAVLLQVAFIFLIWNRYSLDLARLNLRHPDQCTGLAPLGNLAIAAYVFMFALAMIQGIDVFAGQTFLEGVLAGDLGSALSVAVWLLFLIALLFVFEQLVYRPHVALRRYQCERLDESGRQWTEFYHKVQDRLESATEATGPSAAQAGPRERGFREDLELLETWSRLDKYFADMHTWPISSATLRVMAVLVNPFIPLVVPAVVEFLRAS